MRLRRASLLIAVAGLTASPAFPAQDSADQAAGMRAEALWLHFIDEGKYHDAWASAAKVMQEAAPEAKFVEAMRGARFPLGTLSTRALRQAQVTTQLPGAPDGHYVVVQYTTRFENKKEAVETVVASQSPDGSWHVSGYFVR